MIIRPAAAADLAARSDLCLRSKAVWGYDAAFMAACRDELTLSPEELSTTSIALALDDEAILAMVQVEVTCKTGDLLKLLADPKALRSGFGKVMFDWAVSKARGLGARRMTIEADPDAVPFYRRMGE